MDLSKIQSLLPRATCVIDVEATGLDWVKDRIVQLAVVVLDGSSSSKHEYFFNPGFAMSEEVIKVHGITNEMACLAPPFDDLAMEIFELLRDKDLIGFNLMGLDVPMLWEELYRAGYTWDLNGIRMIDAGNIFKKKEERTLSAAVSFYLNREHNTAHNALGDVAATLEVLSAQLDRYLDLSQMSVDELAEVSLLGKRLDFANKIVIGPDGRPTYNIGQRSKGCAVEDDLGMAYWMLDRDFPENTKMVLRGIIQEIESRQIVARSMLPLDDEDVPVDSEDIPF